MQVNTRSDTISSPLEKKTPQVSARTEQLGLVGMAGGDGKGHKPQGTSWHLLALEPDLLCDPKTLQAVHT